jgi:hypothetical protein
MKDEGKEKQRGHIKIINAGLDEDHGEIILRGVIEPDSLQHLLVDVYQREVLPVARILELSEAFQHGSVPDVDLGMRGGNYVEQNGVYTLVDPVYIVDGLQRRTAALEVIKAGVVPRLGATIHFNTTMEWERRRFRILNTAQTKLSPNVLLRNMYQEGSVFLALLHGLTFDSSFVLCRKVNWEQRQHKNHLLSVLTLVRSSSLLHSYVASGLGGTHFPALVENMDKLTVKVGRSVVRDNVRLFWDVIDECWNVRDITVKQMAGHLKMGFLTSLSQLIARHVDFWADSRLVVSRQLRRKFKAFNLNDPYIRALCGGYSAGSPSHVLYATLLDHMNRRNKLTPIKDDELPVVSVDVLAEKYSAEGRKRHRTDREQ